MICKFCREIKKIFLSKPKNINRNRIRGPMLFFAYLLINSLVYTTQPLMHGVDIARIEASEGEDISNKPPEVVEVMCLKWKTKALMKTFERLCHETIEMLSDFQKHIQKRYKNQRVEKLLDIFRKQNKCKPTSPTEHNISKKVLNKKNLSVFHKKTQRAFDELLEEYASKDPKSNILNNVQNLIILKIFGKRLSCIRYIYIISNLFHLTFCVELFSSFMRFLLVQEKDKNLLKKLENSVQNYSMLIHEIISRLYKAHHRGEECPFDDDTVDDLWLLSNQFATEYNNEEAFWSKQGIVVGNYGYVYGECMLETWRKLSKNGIIDWMNSYIIED